MAKAEKIALREEKKRRRAERKFTKTEKSWIMYDWANSIYATNIMAAIFPIYFATVATGSANTFYGYAVSVANLLVAAMAPMLGAIGDFRGMKKRLFSLFLIIGLVFTIVMAVFNNWPMMLVGLVISRIGFSGSCLFYDSFLTDVTDNERMDRVSAWGYAMGYIGGSTIPFIISIAIIFVSTIESAVLWYNSTFPSLAAACSFETLAYKTSILLVVIWWALFSIPFLKNVKQVHCVDDPPAKLAKEAFGNVIKTFKSICRDKRILLFIIAYFFYIDGVDTIISLATNYGSTLGLDSIGMILALLVTQIVAVPFSIIFGNLGKKVGGIKMISIAVGVYFVITIIGFLMGFNIETYQLPYEQTVSDAYSQTVEAANLSDADREVLTSITTVKDGKDVSDAIINAAVTSMPSDDAVGKFGSELDRLIYDPDENDKYTVPKYSAGVTNTVEQVKANVGAALADESQRAPYTSALSLSSILFWILATLVGTVQGGIQALSRSYFGQIIPAERSNEYYGFMDIFGKFSCVIGPFLYSFVLRQTGRASLGILSVILLFLGGIITLLCGRKYFKDVPKTEEAQA